MKHYSEIKLAENPRLLEPICKTEKGIVNLPVEENFRNERTFSLFYLSKITFNAIRTRHETIESSTIRQNNGQFYFSIRGAIQKLRTKNADILLEKCGKLGDRRFAKENFIPKRKRTHPLH